MSILDRYLAYAADFEKSYVDDDWSRIGPHFTTDAVYEGEPVANGRAAVVAKLKNSVDRFDRRMDRRIPDFEKPTVQGNTVAMKWKVTYTKKGIPDLVISGKETAVFEGDQIARLGGEFDPAAQKAMGEWMAKHGKVLQG
jgi:hypothetical protein